VAAPSASPPPRQPPTSLRRRDAASASIPVPPSASRTADVLFRAAAWRDGVSSGYKLSPSPVRGRAHPVHTAGEEWADVYFRRSDPASRGLRARGRGADAGRASQHEGLSPKRGRLHRMVRRRDIPAAGGHAAVGDVEYSTRRSPRAFYTHGAVWNFALGCIDSSVQRVR